MPVHSLHVFDRKGKTLFTKRYAKKDKDEPGEEDEEQLSEQRKLVFGMLFSLREVAASLTPDNGPSSDKSLHSVKTGASTLYSYETNSGLRFALYVTTSDDDSDAKSIRLALSHIYNEIWINSVTRSPLYNPIAPNVEATSFEQNLDKYLALESWFR